MSRLDLVPIGYVRHQKYFNRKGEKRYACIVKIRGGTRALRLNWRTATQADIYGEVVVLRFRRQQDAALAKMAQEPVPA